MAAWRYIAVLLLWGCCLCDAVSLVGQGIFFPLVPTDPLHFSTMFQSNTSLLVECANKNSSVWLQKHQKCSREYEMKRSIYENSDPLKDCRLNLDFLHCFKKMMKELEEVCEWSEKEFLAYSYPVRAFQASLHYACKKDAKIYNDYLLGRGPACVSKSHPELRSCMTLHQPSMPIAYNKDNCRVAWDFYGCIEDKLYDTCLFADIEFIDMCAQIIVEGLKATPCWHFAPIYFNRETNPEAEEEPEEPTQNEPNTPESLPNTSNNAETEEKNNPSDEESNPPEVDSSEEPGDSEPNPGGGGCAVLGSALQIAVTAFFLYVSVAP